MQNFERCPIALNPNRFKRVHLHSFALLDATQGTWNRQPMRAVIQRVKRAKVTVNQDVTGEIGDGLLVLLGAGHGDGATQRDWMLQKIVNLRIFRDEADKMNRSLLDTGGSLLVVSQFTLYGDCRKGRRPSFVNAMHPDEAEPLVDEFVAQARALGITVETGRFGAMMDVELVNDGPVTMLLDSDKNF